MSCVNPRDKMCGNGKNRRILRGVSACSKLAFLAAKMASVTDRHPEKKWQRNNWKPASASGRPSKKRIYAGRSLKGIPRSSTALFCDNAKWTIHLVAQWHSRHKTSTKSGQFQLHKTLILICNKCFPRFTTSIVLTHFCRPVFS